MNTNRTTVEYQPLLSHLLPHAESDDGPVLRAAGDKDPTVLQQILQQASQLSPDDRSTYVLDAVHDEGLDGRWDSALLRAIACQRVANVQELLRHGADPNGISKQLQESYSFRFRRFKSAEVCVRDTIVSIGSEEVGDAKSQLLPLTEVELGTRRRRISRFWSDVNILPLNFSENGDNLHSLVMAAKTTLEIFNTIYEGGADASFWVGPDTATRLPEPLTPSSLCLSTPLHSAIASGNQVVLNALLSNNFSPNARSLIAGCQALTPIQFAASVGKIDSVPIIAGHPLADMNLLTPVYCVHLLHFAVAQLRPDIINAIPVPLSSAPPTALGHVLLHVACLPYVETDIQLFAPKVKESIHDVRTLDTCWTPDLDFLRTTQLDNNARADCPNVDGPGGRLSIGEEVETFFLGQPLAERRSGPPNARYLQAPSRSHFPAQTEIVKDIVRSLGASQISRADVYGNTAMHYLASTRIVNNELIAYLRAQDQADAVWTRQANDWGWTPADLWVDNVTAIERPLNEQRRSGRARGRGSGR